jgi:hypothetical protein
MRPSVPDVHITDSQDAELAEYRSLAGQAVVALIFGLLAPAALIDPLLWLIPAVGVIMGWWALRCIRRGEPEVVGRKMALFGLMFSLLFLAAAPADWVAYRWLLRDEAQKFAGLWFQYIMQDEPEKALQLTVEYRKRLPFDDKLAAHYRKNTNAKEQFDKYVETPTIKMLRDLGPKAQVHYSHTSLQGKEGANDVVVQQYDVSYEEDGEKKSFWVSVSMQRNKLSNGNAAWRINYVQRDNVKE